MCMIHYMFVYLYIYVYGDIFPDMFIRCRLQGIGTIYILAGEGQWPRDQRDQPKYAKARSYHLVEDFWLLPVGVLGRAWYCSQHVVVEHCSQLFIL